MSEQGGSTKGVNRRQFMGHAAGTAVFARGVAVIGGEPTLGAGTPGAQATDSDVALTRRAFTALAKGDSAPAVESLGADVRWNAVASRESARAVTLDRRGADAYLQRMARSISSGERGLEVVSVSAEGDTVRVVSAWTERGGARAECANVVRFDGGKVISVTEAAR